MSASNRSRKVLCVSLHERADYTRALLASLGRCAGIEDYRILANVDEGCDEAMALALSVNFAQIDISVKPRSCNFGERAFRAIDRGFGKAEFVAYVDGETAVSSDFLQYLEYAAEAYRDDSDVFLAACEGGDQKVERAVARRPARLGSALGIWRNRWEWSKRTTRAKASGYPEALVKLVAKYRLQEVYPLVTHEVPGPHADLFHESSPLLTAVMITGLHRERYGLARIAIECFKAQTWPNRKLLIVNHGEESLSTGDPRICELRFRKSPWQTVGDLRNLALEHATGDFVINWDDDDWHHPKRMEVQMRARGKDTAVLLRSRIHHSLVNGCSRYAEYPKGAEATILHPRAVPFRYPSLLRGSDTVFAQQFPVRLPIENDPAMHIRFFHGLNLWDAGHIMGHLADAEAHGKSEIREEHRELLAQVLPLYGHRLGA